MTSIKTLATRPTVRNAELANVRAGLASILNQVPLLFNLPDGMEYKEWIKKASVHAFGSPAVTGSSDHNYTRLSHFAFVTPVDEFFEESDEVASKLWGHPVFPNLARSIYMDYHKVWNAGYNWIDENEKEIEDRKHILEESNFQKLLDSLNSHLFREESFVSQGFYGYGGLSPLFPQWWKTNSMGHNFGVTQSFIEILCLTQLVYNELREIV